MLLDVASKACAAGAFGEIAARSDAMVELTDVTAGYGKCQVLHGVSLRVEAGECITLMGRNGMGKSTTIAAIMGFIAPKTGTVKILGSCVNGWPTFRIAQLGIGLVPEGRQIFPTLTVEENLLATAALRATGNFVWTKDSIYDLFPRLRERSGQLGATLSGGEQQMLAIGRALMTNPRLMILDEATEGIAPLIRTEIWRCLDKIKKSGVALIVIDKHIAALQRLADRCYILEKGSIVWRGTFTALRSKPQLLRDYVGM